MMKVPEKVYSNFFGSWLDVVEVIDDQNWFFSLNGKIFKAKTPLSEFKNVK